MYSNIKVQNFTKSLSFYSLINSLSYLNLKTLLLIFWSINNYAPFFYINNESTICAVKKN